MVKGVIDRMEGAYVIVEFAPETGAPFTLDVLHDNFDTDVEVGDVVLFYSVNNIELTENNTCIYKDLQRADTLKRYLAPLGKKVDCTIVVDKKATSERSEEMKNLIASLWK